MYHSPVMVKEVLEFLNCKVGGTYVDATLGGGGHAKEILEKIDRQGVLIGIDADEEALSESKKTLSEFGENVIFIHDNFADIKSALSKIKLEKVDGIVADLGVSSHQLDEADRGFSFRKNAALDMRMNQEQRLTAGEVVNKFSERELADIFFEFGEERFSRRIARAVIKERASKGEIETTEGLAKIVETAVPFRGKIHPATRVFQALRIFVNGELENLQRFLKDAPDVLQNDGRLVVISYHSLEDRLVKNCFRDLKRNGGYEVITAKPLTAGYDEIRKNPRARSAKLRAVIKN